MTENAHEATGFDRTRADFITITKQGTIAGQTRTIKVKNYIAEYKRQPDLLLVQGELARFTIFATPNIEIAGRALNPISHLSTEELVQRLQEKYSNIDNLRKVGSCWLPILGTSVTVTRYAGTTTIVGGQRIDVVVHIAKVSAGEDTIISVAVYPQQIDLEEETHRMFKGIQQ